MFSCTECGHTTVRKHDLQRLMKRHAKTPLTPNLPPRMVHRNPISNIIDPPTNDYLLEHQEMKDILSNQARLGVTRMTPTDVPDEVRQFFQEEKPWETDQNLPQVYVRNFHRIRDSETNHRCSRIFLRYLHHDHAPLIETIAQALEHIFRHQTNAFKINLSFSFILQHRETGEFRYHCTSNNNQLLNSPKLIRNQQDIDNLLDFLASQDFSSHLKDQCPNTKWVIERIVSLRIRTSRHDHIPT